MDMRLLRVGPKSCWQRHTAGLAAMVLLAGACAPVSKLPEIDQATAEAEAQKQREITIEELEKGKRLIHRLSLRIQTANAELCEKTANTTGARIVAGGSSKKPFARARRKVYGLGNRAKVIQVPRGSAAWTGGLRDGDEILAIGGENTPEKAGKVEGWINKRLDDLNAEGPPIPITVKRKGETVSVEVTPVPICDYPFHVVQDDAVNAAADSETVEVYTGMIRFAENDDELALILGHELAHNTMGHIQKGEGNYLAGVLVGAVFGAVLGVDLSGVGGRIGAGAFSQEFESEADYVGVYYAARAGFDVSGAAKLWRRMAARNPGSIHLSGTTHPSSAKRFIAIEKTAEEVAAKKARSAPLVPEKKDGDGAEVRSD